MQRVSPGIVLPFREGAGEDATCAAGCGEVRWLPHPVPNPWRCEVCTLRAERAAAAERRATQRREDWAGALEACGVPPAYRAVPRSIALPERLAGWTGDPWSVTLLGPTGSGKTWTAIRLLGELYCAGYAGMYHECSLALELLRRQIATPDDGRMFDALVGAEVLLLDDFGAERDTDFARDRLSIVLRTRFDQARPTIVTSNADSLEAIAKVEPRLASRLKSGIVTRIAGADRRVTGKRP